MPIARNKVMKPESRKKDFAEKPRKPRAKDKQPEVKGELAKSALDETNELSLRLGNDTAGCG
jgi:hypothetical protein